MRSTRWALICVALAMPATLAAAATTAEAPETSAPRVGPGAAAPANGCVDADACLARLHALAAGHDPDGPAPEGAFELADALAKFPETIPVLVSLLSDPDESLADLAGLALSSAPSIPPEHLPAIRAGLDRKLGWLPGALGRVATDEAAREAVARYLVSRSAPHNQEAFALERQGARALPAILEAARCRAGCGEDDAYHLGAVLREMGAVAAPIVPDLLALAEDPSTAGDVAAGALLMVEYVGRHAQPAVPRLLALRDAKPELRSEIDDALIATGDRAAGAVFAERLGDRADIRDLQTLAELGAAGVDAGPAVLALLDETTAARVAANAPMARLLGADADGVRVAAVRALGAIGYAPAATRLVMLLDDPRDVRVNWAAAEALGRLGVADSAAALERAAMSHWYPPVRTRAAASLAALRRGVPEPAPSPDDEFTWEAFDAIPDDIASCGDDAPRDAGSHAPGKLYASDEDDLRRLRKLAYDSAIFSYGASDEEEQKARVDAGEQAVIEVNGRNMQQHREPVREPPAVALKVPGGWLAGANRGEWGGELMFLPDDGAPVKLFDGNVEDIYAFGDGWIATTGLAHLTMNEGAVLAVRRDAGDRWRAATWRILPGAANRSWPIATGEILIEAHRKGMLLLSPDGSFRMADCVPASPDEDAAAQAAEDAATANAAAAAAAAARTVPADEGATDPDE